MPFSGGGAFQHGINASGTFPVHSATGLSRLVQLRCLKDAVLRLNDVEHECGDELLLVRRGVVVVGVHHTAGGPEVKLHAVRLLQQAAQRNHDNGNIRLSGANRCETEITAWETV